MAFLRFLLQVLLGFALGFATAVFLLPDVNINIGLEPARKGETARANPAAASPGGSASANAGSGPGAVDSDNTVFGRRGGSSGSAVRIDSPEPVAETRGEEPAGNPVAVNPAPAPGGEPAPRPEPAPSAPAAVAAVDNTPVDFGELCIKPAAWPPIITLTKETSAQVRQGEEVIAEIPLAVGDKLQVSKVFGDGTVEVRAKGAKFVIPHVVTDLEPQARARLNEISGKPRAPAPQPVAQRPAPAPARPAPKPEEEPAPQRNNDDLDRKMRSLFGTPERR